MPTRDFFHLQACHRGRKNRIQSLWVDGAEIVSEQQLAQCLYEHYNTLLGTPFTRTRRLDLSLIGLPSIDLSGLENVFSEDEVRQVIMNLPNDKAPGPDGFTGLFYKLTWDIIKRDVMDAVNAFWARDGRRFSHLNGALMVLLKKRDQPTEIKDYRPISLMHSFAKLITKCLADRLAPKLEELVSRNQSAFIKGRSIQDNFRTVRLSCKEMHAKRACGVLLKIDVAKAFDTFAWLFLLEVLAHMGFGQRWRDWISLLLGTANTKILLNGQAGRRICHAQGLRQGDPLSPMLFVLVEGINRTIRWLDTQNALTRLGPVEVQRVSLYANDLIMLLVPNTEDLLATKTLLQNFGEASGLFANLDKSVATPLHCQGDDLDRILHILGCRIEDFPSKYLGIPLSIFKLKKCDEQSIIDKIAARIPLWKGNLLNVAGRTALARATLSAIPVHLAIALLLSPWAIDCIDKLRRAFIWSGGQSVAAGKCKVAWETICRPRDLGRLGVTDLRRAGVALRVRWMWLRRVDGQRTWGLLPDANERKVVAVFQAATMINLGNGASTMFWTDNWIDGSVRALAPTVFAAVPKRRRSTSVADALNNRSWVRQIAGPCTMRLINEFLMLWAIFERVQLTPGVPDAFRWRWSSDRNYSAASAYGAMFVGSSTPLGAKLIWKTAAPPRVQFFFWLVLHGRCWTASRR